MSSESINLICCHGCGLLINLQGHNPQKTIHCYRCRTLLHKGKQNNQTTSFIMAVTSLLLFFPTLYFPLLKISLYHFESQINLWDTIEALFQAHYPFLGFAVALTILLIPIFYSLLVAITFFIKTNCRPVRKTLKLINILEQWHMVDVFLLGVLVSIVKLISNFDLEIGRGFYFLITLAITLTITKTTFDLQQIWERIDE